MIQHHSKHKLRSKVWLLRGMVHSVPGILELSSRQLSFTVIGSGTLWRAQLRALGQMARQADLAEKLERGEPVQIFRVPVEQIEEVVFPWYYFNGGAVIAIDKTPYRFSFLQPQNTKIPAPGDGEITAALGEIFETGKEVIQGRRLGKAWKAALSQR